LEHITNLTETGIISIQQDWSLKQVFARGKKNFVGIGGWQKLWMI
jgi:hypothetical protein